MIIHLKKNGKRLAALLLIGAMMVTMAAWA